jgi:NitT/TauT family transport system substrate-binding protein
MRKRFLMFLVILSVMTLGITACNKAPDTQTLRIGYGSDIDPADVADQMGFDLIPSDYKAVVTALNEDSAAVAGLIKGQLDIVNMGLPDAIKAIAMGVPLRVIMLSNMRMEFVQVAQKEITSVNDLRGKKVAFHAIGSGTEILPKVLIRQAGMALTDVQWITLPESPNRAAAMIARRIDSTALEFADVLTLQDQGEYNIIGSFGETFPQAISSCFVVTEMFAEKNADVIQAFNTAMLQGYAKANADKEAWLEACRRICPHVPADKAGKTYDFYLSIGMFPTVPLLTQEAWDAMNEFYVETGEYEDPAPLDILWPDLIPSG